VTTGGEPGRNGGEDDDDEGDGEDDKGGSGGSSNGATGQDGGDDSGRARRAGRSTSSSVPAAAAAAATTADTTAGERHPQTLHAPHRLTTSDTRTPCVTHRSPIIPARRVAAVPLAEHGVWDDVDNDDVAAAFKPFLRISPPWTGYEYVRTALCVVFLLPFRLAFLGFTAGLLWLIARLAMVGLRGDGDRDGDGDGDRGGDEVSEDGDGESRRAVLQIPPARWRRLLVAALPPIVRALLFVSFGIYRIKTQKRPHPPCCEAFLAVARHEASAAGRGACTAPSFAAPASQCDAQHGSVGATGAPAMPPHVLVSNHLGYLDIFALFVKYRGSFVAKEDIEKMPVVGPIARATRCLFIHDGVPLAPRLVERMRATEACRCTKPCAGCGACLDRLIVFPEGTTTNGTAMIPFRTGAFLAGLPVLPICVQFPHKHFNPTWETILLREHLFRCMTQLRNDITITELPVYVPDADERTDARLYASRVAAVMAHVLELPIVPVSRKHKVLYHSYVLGKVTDKRELLSRADALRSEDELLQYVSSEGSLKSAALPCENSCVSLL
jgi:1-acyl-sn-glycerol-3-phosphate acyltransferase